MARWTESEEEQVRTLWVDHTPEQIGKQLHRPPGAIRARAAKLGLGARIPKKDRPNGHRVAPVTRWEPRKQYNPPAKVKAPRPPEKMRKAEVVSQRVFITELKGCKYPDEGDDPITFCNGPIERGVYCAAHAALCYVTVQTYRELVRDAG